MSALERRGGTAERVRCTLHVSGARLDRGFVAFAERRARLLSLDLRVEAASATAVRLAVGGPAHLIDMLEMAALLGPLDARVDGIERVGGIEHVDAVENREDTGRRIP